MKGVEEQPLLEQSGVLAYIVYRLMCGVSLDVELMKTRDFKTLARVRGEVETAVGEWVRTVVEPYEQRKREENGVLLG